MFFCWARTQLQSPSWHSSSDRQYQLVGTLIRGKMVCHPWFNSPWEVGGRRRRGDRGWDGWMASLTQWAWVWVNSGRWWWTGRPGVLRFMGSQRAGHDWVTELNWTETYVNLVRERMQELTAFPTHFLDHEVCFPFIREFWLHEEWCRGRSKNFGSCTHTHIHMLYFSQSPSSSLSPWILTPRAVGGLG